MKAKDAQENPWLVGEPMVNIMGMLVELDRCSLLPSEMRQALTVHAEELLDVLPGFIEETSNMLARELAENGNACSSITSQVSWSIKLMANTMAALQPLARLESERQKYPEIYATIRKACGVNIKLAHQNVNPSQ